LEKVLFFFHHISHSHSLSFFFLKKLSYLEFDNFIESAGVSVLNLKKHWFDYQNNLFSLKGNTDTAGRNLTSGEIILQDLKLDLLFNLSYSFILFDYPEMKSQLHFSTPESKRLEMLNYGYAKKKNSWVENENVVSINFGTLSHE